MLFMRLEECLLLMLLFEKLLGLFLFHIPAFHFRYKQSIYLLFLQRYYNYNLNIQAMSSSTNFPSSGTALVTVTEPKPSIFVLAYLGAQTPDNRLTPQFLTAVLEALNFVEKKWEDISMGDNVADGAALISTAALDSKIFSNGLDFESAIADPDFFDKYLFPVYEKLLSFPIPTIASVGGHGFAAGFGLAMAHDFRVMNGNRGYLCMNEIDFGAQLPPGLFAVLEAKIRDSKLMRKIVLEGHRFSASEALENGIVDFLSPGKGEKGAAKETLDGALALADKIRVKASKDAWGSNKLVLYHPWISVLRTPNGTATSKL